MKTLLAAVGIVCLALPACAQSIPDGPAPALVTESITKSVSRSVTESATKSAAEHNFFNWKNSLLFGIQAGGAVWYARERNGTLSNVTDLAYWQRTQYLKDAYLQAAFFSLATDGAAYAIHKSGHGWKRHMVEHLLVGGSSAGLYIFANRNRHEYNTQECRFGLNGFCR